jgi:hypothetical protein
MSRIDYAIDISLILIVVLQMRPRAQTWRAMSRPLLLVAAAGVHYLRAVHLGGNDIALIGMLTLVGVILGAASGLATRLWRDKDGAVIAQAGPLAALLWVICMGFRFAFALYAGTNAGGERIAHFSVHHDITSAHVWTTALVLMAFAEVLARVTHLQLRTYRVRSESNAATTSRPAECEPRQTPPTLNNHVVGRGVNRATQ